MKKSFLIVVMFSLFAFSCDRRDMSETTGSGAGIETIEREELETEDMNITTPIDERPELEEIEEQD